MPLSSPAPFYPLLGNIVAQYHPILQSTFGALGANQMGARRVVIPYDGTLHGLTVMIGTSSGNIDLGIWNTAVTTRALLYSSGSIACGTANSWQTPVDPNLVVKRGDHLDFAVASDNGTATFARGPATITTNIGDLPPGYLTSPLGGVNVIAWAKSTAFPMAGISPLAESNVVANISVPFVMAYLTPDPA